MTTGAPLLLLTADPATARAVERAAAGQRLVACRDAREAEQRLAAEAPRLLLLDAPGDARPALQAAAALAARHPDLRLVLLCDAVNAELLLEAMQAGVRHCMTRAALPTELDGVLRRLGRAPGAAAPAGRLVTVLSASGGCGCTTVAIGLADELLQSGAGRVQLVDLDLHYGAVAAYLGLRGVYGVADALSRSGPIDAQLVASSSCASAEGLQVLLSPAAVNPSHPPAMDWARLPELLDACREAAAVTVLDAARVPPDVAAQLVRASALSLLVFELAVVDIRTARAQLGALLERGLPAGSVLPVANRVPRKPGVPSLQDARDALGCEVETLANDFTAALRALNHGEPVTRGAARSPLRDDLRRLAARLGAVPDAAAARR